MPPAWLFALSLAFLPLFLVSAWLGGWALLAVPVVLWGGASVVDLVSSANTTNPGAQASDSAMLWHLWLLLAWVPLQIGLIFGSLYYGAISD